MAHSSWVTETSLIKGLLTKGEQGFKKRPRDAEVPQG